MPSVSSSRATLGAAAFVVAALCLYKLTSFQASVPTSSSSRPSAPTPPPTSFAAPPPAQAADAPVSAEGLILYGVSGGGPGGMAAIIGLASGYQRLVRVGRDYRPGLRLTEVGPTHALLSGAGRETRLELNRFAGASGGGSAQTRATEASTPVLASIGGMDRVDLRLGMVPRKSNGRIDGFSFKRGADLPVLRRAGLQPGDVIVAVNGQPFDSAEKLMELPGEIAGSYTAEFEFERGGRRMTASLPINARPKL